jgi:hypothetical protein
VSSTFGRLLLQTANEVLFALNTACAIVFLAFATSEVYVPFAHLEVAVNHVLHIRQTDFIRGHFEFWIPALGLAGFFGLALRLSSRAQLKHRLLRSFAGASALFLPPAAWICADQHRSLLLASPYVPLELAVLTAIFLFVVFSKWSVSLFAGLACVTAHYVFWYWLFNGFHIPNWNAPGYFGPVGPSLALCASLIWVAYFTVNSRSRPEGTSPNRN